MSDFANMNRYCEAHSEMQIRAGQEKWSVSSANAKQNWSKAVHMYAPW